MIASPILAPGMMPAIGNAGRPDAGALAGLPDFVLNATQPGASPLPSPMPTPASNGVSLPEGDLAGLLDESSRLSLAIAQPPVAQPPVAQTPVSKPPITPLPGSNAVELHAAGMSAAPAVPGQMLVPQQAELAAKAALAVAIQAQPPSALIRDAAFASPVMARLTAALAKDSGGSETTPESFPLTDKEVDGGAEGLAALVPMAALPIPVATAAAPAIRSGNGNPALTGVEVQVGPAPTPPDMSVLMTGDAETPAPTPSLAANGNASLPPLTFDTAMAQVETPRQPLEEAFVDKTKHPAPEIAEPNAPRADRALLGMVQQLIGERGGLSSIQTDQPIDSLGAEPPPVSGSGVVPTSGLTAILQPGIRPTMIDVAMPLAAAPVDQASLAIERQLDLSNATEWLDSLARDIASAANLKERLSFSLSPAHLGRLDVEMSAGEAGVSVGFRAENADARAIIAQAQPRLAEEMRNNGLRLADTQVFSGAGQERENRGQAPQQDGAAAIIETANFLTTETNEDDATAPTGRFA